MYIRVCVHVYNYTKNSNRHGDSDCRSSSDGRDELTSPETLPENTIIDRVVPSRHRNWFLLPDESRLCTLQSVPEHVDVTYPYRYRNRALSAERSADPAAVKEENDQSNGGLGDHRADLVGGHVARATRRPSRETTPRVSFEGTDDVDDVASDAACQTNGSGVTLAMSDSLRRTMRSLSDQVQDIRSMLLTGKNNGNVGTVTTVLANGGKGNSDSFASLTSLQRAIIRDSISNVAGTVKIVVDDFRMRRRELCHSPSPRPKSEVAFSECGSPSVTSGHTTRDRVASARGGSDMSSSRRRRRRSAHDIERIACARDYKRRSRSLEHYKQSTEVNNTHVRRRHDDADVMLTLHPTYALHAGHNTVRLVRSPRCEAIPWYM